MEEHFVNYTQALALKELGFDEPCFAYFKDEEFQYPNLYEPFKNSEQKSWFVTAPIKSQVFKWFRDKHQLNHWIDLNFRTQKYILQIWRGRECLLNDHSMKSYEEAESECIDKLIEIIKEKKS